jgi:hypothetical protein
MAVPTRQPRPVLAHGGETGTGAPSAGRTSRLDLAGLAARGRRPAAAP